MYDCWAGTGTECGCVGGFLASWQLQFSLACRVLAAAGCLQQQRDGQSLTPATSTYSPSGILSLLNRLLYVYHTSHTLFVLYHTCGTTVHHTHPGPLLPGQSTPLESLRSRWQAAAEALCNAHGFAPSPLGVVVSEIMADGDAGGAELPVGVHQYRQVQDWITTTAAQAQRTV